MGVGETLDVTGETEGAVTVAAGRELTVVVPTRNERDNVGPLVDLLRKTLEGIAWEVLFVDDDSTDGTVPAVRALAQSDSRVRLLHRIGRRGLSSACIEGIQASTTPYVAVMDADLQHDEALLPAMLATLKTGQFDLVVGSRYVEGGGIANWDKQRANISGFATRLSNLVLKAKIADPMSGFFMLPRATFDRAVRNLSALGFKILVDLVASSPGPLRIKELPYQFRLRVAGESKLDAQVAWEYLMLLADKLVGRLLPLRFVLFSIVGTIGLAAHLILLWASLMIGASFNTAQSVATIVAMIGNFLLNNLLTYADRRLRDWALVLGLVTFCLVCGVGAVANVAIADYLFSAVQDSWWVAGIAGYAISAVWNYAVSSVVTWKRR